MALRRSGPASRPPRLARRPPRPGRGSFALPWWRNEARRWLAANALILFLEVTALAVSLTAPPLQAQRVVVEGATRITPDAVRRAAQLPSTRSMLLLRPGDIQARLERIPWIESARVEFRLLNQVRIQIKEWTPVAILRVRESSVFLGASGRVLGPAGDATSPVTIVAPAAEDRAGRTAVDARLLRLLTAIAPQWEGAYGIGLKEFRLDGDLELSIVTAPGWRVILGQMATDEQRASLGAKLQALKALQARYNFGRDPIEYINVMNEAAPTVKIVPVRR